MLVFNFLFVVGGDIVGSGSKVYDLLVPSSCKQGSSCVLEAKAIAMTCFLTHYPQSSSSPEIRCESEVLTICEY